MIRPKHKKVSPYSDTYIIASLFSTMSNQNVSIVGKTLEIDIHIYI